ncbi:MAG: phosphoenolpyruvate--protein phosphotransferase [Phycisphaerales bacterium]|nr:phosphoenolpyruvate--protein phosphotransferase [Phycisphaerales bacterium]
MEAIKGIGVSAGIAIGRALLLVHSDRRASFRTVGSFEIENEIQRMARAIADSIEQLLHIRNKMALRGGKEAARIFDFHLELLGDPTLIGPIREDIAREGVVAEYAVSENFRKLADRFRGMGSDIFAQKAADVIDLERRVLSRLGGRPADRIATLKGPVIVIAHELTPSQTVELHRAHIAGFATDGGGLTGHTSILARALELPAVVGCARVSTDVEDGDMIIVDGEGGLVIVRPDDAVLARYQLLARETEHRRHALRSDATQPSVTRDGMAVALLGNIEFPEEISTVLANGGSGVGLYRTEFLYLMSDVPPTEDDHLDSYRRALELSDGRPLVIRTLDLGADKYTQGTLVEAERNPFLGLRSIRFCLANQEMFKTQLRALLRASAYGQIKIMLPLVTHVMELRQTRMLLNDLAEELEEAGIPFDRNIPVGIMVETPAAALMARTFAIESQFFSIGTNDLIQYTLAVDRGNERVASLYNAANPAVLGLIKSITRTARHVGIDVSVCGEIAGQPLFTPLLVGMGVRTLSMSPGQIPAVKRVVRGLEIERCESLARRVGSFDSDRQVLSCLRDELRKIDPEALAGSEGS